MFFSRTAALEEAQMLKTKAMRENEERRYAKNFKYSLIRIRFPDGLYLQVYKRDQLAFVLLCSGVFFCWSRLGDLFCTRKAFERVWLRYGRFAARVSRVFAYLAGWTKVFKRGRWSNACRIEVKSWFESLNIASLNVIIIH